MEARVVVIGVVVSIIVLIAIVVGVKLYYTVSTIDELGQVTERYTGLSNASDEAFTLSYVPNADADCSGTWYNSSSGAWSTITGALWDRTGPTLTLLTNTGGNDGLNMSSANFSYYSQAGVSMRDSVNPQANSVFSLAPVIGLVLIASVIIGAIVVSVGRKP